MARTNWKDYGVPFEDFTEKLTYKWMKNGFDRKQAKEWLDIGMKPQDAGFCAWLKHSKKKSVEWVLSCGDEKELKIEYEKRLASFTHSKLSKETINQIKDFNRNELTREQKNTLEKLIDNQELRENYKSYGLCKECWQINTNHNWCQSCNSKHFQDDFDKWTSGNQKIDKLIKKNQLEASDKEDILEWIPYEQFTNIEFLAQGGFGKVHKAEWIDGHVEKWSVKGKKWQRHKWLIRSMYGKVILKILNDSQNITDDFLQEVANHKLFDEGYIVPCYGISQDPPTKNYIIVMAYVEGNNLRQFLKENYDELDFKESLRKLRSATSGLHYIHCRWLIHKDFHPGNILVGNLSSAERSPITNNFIVTDLGLCRLANEEDKNEIYGVMPYVAPEVLRSHPYTQASDVYSWAIVAYEIFAGKPPHHNIPHDGFLATLICQGLRPDLEKVKIPQSLKDLIEKCWDAEPSKRPAIGKIWDTLDIWCLDHDAEFNEQSSQITQELEEKKLKILTKSFPKIYKQYTHKEIEIEKLEKEEFKEAVRELYKEFCIQNKYEETTEEVEKKFEKVLYSPPNSKTFSYQAHPQAFYTSRPLDFKNLPEPQNSKEINEWFYSSTNTTDSFGPLYSNNIAAISSKIDISTDDLENLSFKPKCQLSLSAETQDNSKSLKLDQEITTEPEEMEIDNELNQLNWEEITKQQTDNWQTLRSTLTSQQLHSWQSNHFTPSQVRDWLNVGLQSTDADFCAWIRDIKGYTPEETLNHGNLEVLSQEFFTWWQEQQLHPHQLQPPK